MIVRFFLLLLRLAPVGLILYKLVSQFSGSHLEIFFGPLLSSAHVAHQFVSRRIGLIATRGWGQHIFTRFREVASADSTPFPFADPEFFTEADSTSSSNSRRGG